MIHKGDDTDAFGFGFLTVNLDNAQQYTISKAEVRIGTIIKTFNSPTFPLHISLTKQETQTLSECCNKIYMAIYDSDNKKWTCEGSLEFKTAPKVV